MLTRQEGHNLLNKNAQKRICIKMKAFGYEFYGQMKQTWSFLDAGL